MEDYLAFKKMILPAIIQVVFWIGVIIVVIAGILTIAEGVRMHGGGTTILTGLLVIFLGPLGLRLACELVMVLFSIHETLTDIKNHLKGTPRNSIQDLEDSYRERSSPYEGSKILSQVKPIYRKKED